MSKKKNMKSTTISTHYYKTSKMTNSERWKEIHKVLRGDYDNWSSFGYIGGTCSGKQTKKRNLFSLHKSLVVQYVRVSNLTIFD